MVSLKIKYFVLPLGPGQGKLPAYGDLIGSREMGFCEPRQAWKGAAVASEHVPRCS